MALVSVLVRACADTIRVRIHWIQFASTRSLTHSSSPLPTPAFISGSSPLPSFFFPPSCSCSYSAHVLVPLGRPSLLASAAASQPDKEREQEQAPPREPPQTLWPHGCRGRRKLNLIHVPADCVRELKRERGRRGKKRKRKIKPNPGPWCCARVCDTIPADAGCRRTTSLLACLGPGGNG